ncbi:DNA-directed RNA polymerase subunit alpha C-terminal domain-containing protein [Actinomadura sp. 9N215]|uniref:DNA-directed RNA polymerase subunit alpha C-terminal domain-containing protein n=1 Tax=Actinomadura sp. 9N215 TaxID=3375150 RepID=UPI003787C7D8
MMNETEHHPHHPGVTVDCPTSCLGVRTVGDLVGLLTRAAQTTLPDAPSPLRPHEEHLLTCPISCLRLPARIISALRAYDPDVRNIGQLISMFERDELSEVRNIGHSSVWDVRKALDAEGFIRSHRS